MNTFVSELKSADGRQKALLLGGIRARLTAGPVDLRVYPELVVAVGSCTASSDLNVKRSALSALVLVLASLKGDTLDYADFAPALLNALPKVINTFGLGSKDEVEAAHRSVQLIYDMIPLEASMDDTQASSSTGIGVQGGAHADLLVKCISDGLGPKAKPNTQIAVLQGMTEAVNRLGEAFAVTMAAELGGVLIRMMDASIGSVREAVPPALQAVYRYSPTIRDRVASSTLRRDEKEKLKKCFDQADAEGETVLSATDAYAKSLVLSELAESASSSSVGLASSSGSVGLSRSGSGQFAKSASVSNITASIKAVKVVSVNSEDELKKEFNDLIAKFNKLAKHDWEGKVGKLQRFQGLIMGGATEQANFMEALKPFLALFQQILRQELRAAILDEVCRSINVLAQTAGDRIGSFIDKLMKDLMSTTHATNVVVSELGTSCISFVLTHAKPPNIGPLICDQSVNSTHVSTRARCVTFIQQLILEGASEYVDRWCDLFHKTLKAVLSDSDGSVRSNARKTFAEFCKRWPRQGRALWAEIDVTVKSALKKDGLALDDSASSAPSLQSQGSGGVGSGGSGAGGSGGDSIFSLHTRGLSGSSSSLPVSHSPNHLGEGVSGGGVVVVVVAPSNGGTMTQSSSSSSLNSEKSNKEDHHTVVIAPSALSAATITSSSAAHRTAPATTSTSTSTAKRGDKPADAKKSSASSSTIGGASRTPANGSSSSSSSSISHVPPASKPMRVAQSETSTVQQTPQRKPASSNNLVPKPVVPPIQNKSNSVSTLNTASLVLDAHAESLSKLPTITSPGRGNYSAASSDTSKFRNMLKRCDLEDIHERTAAIEELKALMVNDELPGLWPNATLCQSFLNMLGRRLYDSQTKVLQATLEMVKIVSCDQKEAWDLGLEILAPPLFQLAFSELARDDFKAEAQALIVSLAEVSAIKLFACVKKVLETPDAKPKLNAVRSLALFITKMDTYFDKQVPRIQKFIVMLTTKPNDIRASVNMTNAVTNVFALLYAMLGETFGAQLRTAKFIGQDQVMKKLKVPAVAPKPGASTSISAAKKSAVAKSSSGASSTSSKASSSSNSSSSTIGSKTIATKAKATGGTTSTSNAAIVPAPAPAKVRPVLQRQKSTSSLPSNSRPMYNLTLQEANMNLGRDLRGSGGDSTAPSTEMPPQTPSRETLRREIQETPNVLATVMLQPVIISPLTPLALKHGGTPSFASLGRSTSTPQLRSVKYSGRKGSAQIDLENGLGIFSPPKFSLDSADEPEVPRGPEPTPLKPLVDKLSSRIQKEAPQWDEADQTLKLLHSAIGNVSADHILQSLDHEELLVKLELCLDRSYVPLKIRQGTCNVIALLKDRIPARDWEPHFAKLDDRHQRLLAGFLKKSTHSSSSSSSAAAATAASSSSSSSATATTSPNSKTVLLS